MPTQPLHLVIKSREKTIFDGDIVSVSSINERGDFAVLALHSNFISVVRDRVRIQTVDGSTVDVDLEHAVMRVSENHVEVFIGLH